MSPESIRWPVALICAERSTDTMPSFPPPRPRGRARTRPRSNEAVLESAALSSSSGGGALLQLLVRHDLDLDATVLRAPFRRVVRCDRRQLAVTLRAEPVLPDALVHQE